MGQVTVSMVQGFDDQGDLQQFTWDLIPLVAPQETMHLGENGLPKKGTLIKPGMIIIGSIGKSSHYKAEDEPDPIEWNRYEADEMRAKYGHMWKDMSLRANVNQTGQVVDAWLRDLGGRVEVGVVIE